LVLLVIFEFKDLFEDYEASIVGGSLWLEAPVGSGEKFILSVGALERDRFASIVELFIL